MKPLATALAGVALFCLVSVLPRADGHSLTIWKKQGGSWKVVDEAVSATPGAETIK